MVRVSSLKKAGRSPQGGERNRPEGLINPFIKHKKYPAVPTILIGIYFISISSLKKAGRSPQGGERNRPEGLINPFIKHKKYPAVPTILIGIYFISIFCSRIFKYFIKRTGL